MKLLIGLILCVALIGAFKWDCTYYESAEENNGKSACWVHNITSEALRTAESMDGPSYDALILENITASPEDFWKTANFNSTKDLYIRYSKLSRISIPPNLEYIAIVNTDNSLLEIDETVDYKLSTIGFSYLNLEDLPNLTHFRRLKNVFGNMLPLKSLNFTAMSGLTELEHIDFSNLNSPAIISSGEENLPNLSRLEISNSSLREIPTNLLKLTSLKDFNLPDNQIQFVEMSIFNNMDRLQILDLSENRGMQIKTSSPVRLPSLKILWLEGCELEHLDVQLWEMPSLEFLNVRRNKLHEVANLGGHLPKGLKLGAENNLWNCQWLRDNSINFTFSTDEKDDESENCNSKVKGICCRENEI